FALHQLYVLKCCTPPVATCSPYRALCRSEKGSTSRITLGSGASARASAPRCCWPPDRVWGNAPADSSIPTCRRASCARRWRSARSEEHTSELQSRENLVCRLLLEKTKM